MIAEILSTGDEIRSGTLIDSNTAYIARSLEQNGIIVRRHHSAGDDIPALTEILLEISRRAEVGIVTGGLGPTSDDLTAEAAAQAAGVPLRMNSEALTRVEQFFQRINRVMSDSNRKQALLPEGSTIIDNPIGSAPGFRQEIGSCRFFFLPGVPAEMKRMMKETVIPTLREFQGNFQEFSLIHTISTFGLTESATGEKLSGFPTVFPEIGLGFRARFPEIQVKFYLHGTNQESMRQRIAKAINWVTERLGDAVFSVTGESMERVIGRLLAEECRSLAVAESCTGGLISHWVTNVAGSSRYFLCGAVTYSNDAKIQALGVSGHTLENFGAVSEETVREMADGIRKASAADYGLATSGIAGPDGGTPEKPVGTLCIGLASAVGIITRRFVFRFRGREALKQIFAMAALDLLRRQLTGKNCRPAGDIEDGRLGTFFP